MTSEGKVKELIDRFLKKAGAYYFKPVSGGLGTHGIPDYVGCYRGCFFGIEAKKPCGKPTALQILQAARIEAAGGKWFLVDGIEALADVILWMEGVDNDTPA